MKKNKAVKRLTKIEALLSDVTERYSAGAAHIQEALQSAKDAVIRAKDAVNLQVSAVAKGASVAVKVATGSKAAPARKKARSGKVVVKTPAVKNVKTSAPIKKVAKKTTAGKAPKSTPPANRAGKGKARHTAATPAQTTSEPTVQ